MNGGREQQNNPGSQSWLTLPGSVVVTPEQYRQVQQNIASAREYVTQIERQNEEAYRLYVMAEQELRNRVEQGREAEYVQIFQPVSFSLIGFQDGSSLSFKGRHSCSTPSQLPSSSIAYMSLGLN